ncbi:hypothetical protein L198_02502 [Cryptococcus wingfieldii CBS 7118]|uniref:Uncharacterized protein n=1 Tax=Cryptococcus wingfieldii CBS 7118 TaxID=1295528 RepID=A0A1E3JRZ1_9TREE|nr:hypothetical protein L198_02502 [Cryptococcus wingfieldii CBS 7118]ODO03651.1 hypothetical protein L198_02502 [Cryptococcus wingfieldii CBS 7118]
MVHSAPAPSVASWNTPLGTSGLSGGPIAGIILGVVIGCVIAGLLIAWRIKRRTRGRRVVRPVVPKISAHTSIFTKAPVVLLELTGHALIELSRVGNERKRQMLRDALGQHWGEDGKAPFRLAVRRSTLLLLEAMKQSRLSRKSRGRPMDGGVAGVTKMFGLYAHIIEDTSTMSNLSRFSLGATNLREDDLEASWPATRIYQDLYTQDLASSLAQSPMSDAYRIDVLTWKLDDHPEFKAALEGLVSTHSPKIRLIDIELLLVQAGAWKAYLSDLNSVATSHPQADLQDTWVPPPEQPLGNNPLPFDECHIDTNVVMAPNQRGVLDNGVAQVTIDFASTLAPMSVVSYAATLELSPIVLPSLQAKIASLQQQAQYQELDWCFQVDKPSYLFLAGDPAQQELHITIYNETGKMYTPVVKDDGIELAAVVARRRGWQVAMLTRDEILGLRMKSVGIWTFSPI